MGSITRKRFTRVICYLLAASFSFAQAVNASVAFPDKPAPDTVEMGHKCDSSSAVPVNKPSLQHQVAMNAVHDMDCEHGVTCKILCNISLSVPYPENFDAWGFDRSTQWFRVVTLTIKTSFPSLLDKPPKS